MPTPFPAERRVATWPQLVRRHGQSHVRAQLAARRWRRWGRAIVLHNGPLSRHEELFVARVHGAPGSMLTAFSALELVGLRRWDRPEAHVLVGRGARCATTSPVPWQRHVVRDLSVQRCHPGSAVQIPRQAVVVAAASLTNARSACGLLAAAVQQDVTVPVSIRGVLVDRPRVRHRRLLLLTLADIEQGADALSEIDFVRLCGRHGLPVPHQQRIRREPSGRRRYLDASWRRRDGRLLCVEVDGAVHLEVDRWWGDQSRQNEVVLADSVLLRYPSVVLRTDECTVANQLRRGLLL